MKAIVFADPGRKIQQATIRRWRCEPGQAVATGDVLVELDAESVLIELTAQTSGMLAAITCDGGTTVQVGQEIGQLDETQAGTAVKPQHIAVPTAATPKAPTAPKKESASGPSAPVEPIDPASAGLRPIAMPQAGNSMEEGTVLKWHVKIGDVITEGQIICDIETDKATMEYEAPEGGKLAAIVAKENDIIAVKQPIAWLADKDADVTVLDLDAVANPSPAAASSAPAAGASPVSVDLAEKVTPVLMPQAGNSMEEGTVLKWHVKPGDTITQGQVICDIETDKATMEFEAPDAGRLATIIAAEGAVVAVKEPIALLADNDADAQAFLAAGPQAGAPQAKESQAKAPPAAPAAPKSVTAPPVTAAAPKPAAPASVSSTGRVKASPAARRLAGEKQLDLASVGQGSGPGGRILSTDLARARAAGSAAAPPVDKAIKPLEIGIGEAAQSGTVVRRAMTKMRKAIAANLLYSKQNVPHFYVRRQINADPMFAFYRAQKPLIGCTVNDVVLYAVGRTLAEFPAVRSQLDKNEIVEFPTASVGVAVGVEDGLVVPVMTDVDRRTLAEVASESKRIVAAARNGQVENMGKGVFTISNLGMFGVDDFSAIINPPEAAILAVSAVKEAVIVQDGAMRAGRVMNMTLSADHRVVDGLLGAQFMQRLAEVLEHPQLLL